MVVSGAAGFLPAYMVETMLALNDRRYQKPTQVIGLVRSLKRARERFRAYEGRTDLALVEHDISQPFRSSWPPTYIVHAASQASPKFYRADPVGTIAANAPGTEHLLRLAQRGKRSACCISAPEKFMAPRRLAFRPRKDYGPLDCLDVRSCYAESKRLGETLCVAWNAQFGSPGTIVRPFHTYGPGIRLDDGRVFADFVNDIVQRLPLVLKSDGKRHVLSAIWRTPRAGSLQCPFTRPAGAGLQHRQRSGRMQYCRIGRFACQTLSRKRLVGCPQDRRPR